MKRNRAETVPIRIKGVLLGSIGLLAVAMLSGCATERDTGERFMPKLYDTTLGQSGNPPQPILTHNRNNPSGT